MEKEFSLRINGKDYKYPENTTYRQIAADFQKDYENDIALVISNGRLKELFHCPDSMWEVPRKQPLLPAVCSGPFPEVLWPM